MDVAKRLVSEAEMIAFATERIVFGKDMIAFVMEMNAGVKNIIVSGLKTIESKA